MSGITQPMVAATSIRLQLYSPFPIHPIPANLRSSRRPRLCRPILHSSPPSRRSQLFPTVSPASIAPTGPSRALVPPAAVVPRRPRLRPPASAHPRVVGPPLVPVGSSQFPSASTTHQKVRRSSPPSCRPQLFPTGLDCAHWSSTRPRIAGPPLVPTVTPAADLPRRPRLRPPVRRSSSRRRSIARPRRLPLVWRNRMESGSASADVCASTSASPAVVLSASVAARECECIGARGSR